MAGETAAIAAPEIAPAGDLEINGFGGFHYIHDNLSPPSLFMFFVRDCRSILLKFGREVKTKIRGCSRAKCGIALVLTIPWVENDQQEGVFD